jgi:hypothetical protein
MDQITDEERRRIAELVAGARRRPYFRGCAGVLWLSACQGWRVWGAGQLLGFVSGFGFASVRSAGDTLRGWPA